MISYKIPPTSPTKTPLDPLALRDVIDLSLWAGQLLLHFGADTQRIEETIHRLGTGLGADWLDILISPNAVIITTSSGGEFRTKVRRVVNIGVNLTVVDEINRLSRQVAAGELDRAQVRQALERISTQAPQYNRWWVVLMVGMACAAFSRLFGGDAGAFFVTLLAGSAAMFVRQELHQRYFPPYIIVLLSSITAALIGSTAYHWELSQTPQHALAAAVLLSVPGVPLINSTTDLLSGHLVTGVIRGINGGIITLMLALGLFVAIELTGIKL
jgi:uncharacterized membrane protein YjjP (DUF1212 family)